MAIMNYHKMESDPCRNVPSGKRKSAKKNIFRRSSWSPVEEEEFSIPNVIPAESNSCSGEFRDEKPSNRQRNSSNITSREASPQLYNTCQFDAQFDVKFDAGFDTDFATFESNSSLGFDDVTEKHKGEATQLQESLDTFEALSGEIKTKEDTNARSEARMKKTNYDTRSQSSRPMAFVRPAALKLDRWSKTLAQKKGQFKYHNFNEKRTFRSKEKQKEKPKAHSRNSPVVEHKKKKEIECKPEAAPSSQFKYHSFTDEVPVSPINEKSKVKSDGPSFEQPKVEDGDEKDQTNDRTTPKVDDEVQPDERTSIGSLMRNITLQLDHSGNTSQSEKRDKPLELESNDKQCIDQYDIMVTDNKENDHKQNESFQSDEQNNNTTEIMSGNVENLPLLKALDVEEIDCNDGGSKKSGKKVDKKKKLHAIKKLRDGKRFSWKYESMKEKRKDQIEEEDILLNVAQEYEDIIEVNVAEENEDIIEVNVAKENEDIIEVNDAQDNEDIIEVNDAEENEESIEDNYVEMPLCLQLSTITEGDDEDLTASCSPRSIKKHKSTSLESCFQNGGKSTSNAPFESLLDNTNMDAAVSRSTDEVEEFPEELIPPAISNEIAAINMDAAVSRSTDEIEGFPEELTPPVISNEIPAINNENLKTFENILDEFEQPKISKKSVKRSPVSVNEIIVPDTSDDSSTEEDSKGELSDITDDYLHIPVSSPLYGKVLKVMKASKYGDEKF